MFKMILLYLIAINAAAFFLYGSDKMRSKRGQWRIPEKTLFFAAIIGGSIGAFAGMRIFHHKTRHWYFAVGIPLILAVQVLVAAALYLRG